MTTFGVDPILLLSSSSGAARLGRHLFSSFVESSCQYNKFEPAFEDIDSFRNKIKDVDFLASDKAW